MAEKKKNLGMGLSALLGEDEVEYGELNQGEHTKTLPITHLHPGRYQPRHTFKPQELDDLAQSIREKGVLQPLLVRPHPEQVGEFEIIAGERRWRAAQRAQLHELPVIIRDFDDQEALEVALIENLQRQDLTPIEEAEGYKRLQDEFQHTQEVLADVVGKSRAHVANMLRLLGLPDSVKTMLEGGELSAGHARALLTCDDPEAVAREVVAKGLSVRQAEALAKSYGGNKSQAPKKAKAAAEKDSDTLALERDLSNMLGLKVEIRDHGGKGELVVHYKSLDQLDQVLARLSAQS